MATAEEKIGGALERELEKVERECIRPLQVRAFRCSAKCCEDQYSSQQVIQSCLKTCMTPVAESEGRLKQEVEQLQNRLSRCAQQCQDEVQDMLSTNPSQQDTERAKQHAEACLMKCADSHMHVIPKLVARFRASMDTCS